MKLIDSRWVQGLAKLLSPSHAEPAERAERIAAMQLHIVMPAKAGVVAVVFYYVFYSGWFYGPFTLRQDFQDRMRNFILIYVLCNIVGVAGLAAWRRFPPGLVQWLVFVIGLFDGIFMAGLTFITGGFDSMAYWMFPAMIVLNALSIPLATPQIVLNLLLSAFYLSAGILDAHIPPPELVSPRIPSHRHAMMPRIEDPSIENDFGELLGPTNSLARTNRGMRFGELPYRSAEDTPGESTAEPSLPRLIVLWLLTACCYGVQVLEDRQRRLLEEATEFAAREAQLHSAGRLAAEIAHQIKNPLAIINNAAFSLQRALKEGRTDTAKQVKIIQEEVERSDRILTQIMGYAQLSEGRVERLNVAEEIEQAVRQVFPEGAAFGVQVHRQLGPSLPPLLMHRRHLSEILVNLLQNAREALNDRGTVTVTARYRADQAVEITLADDGPGIPADQRERVFEAYYTTRDKGTGLGLAIVKHNVELYAGTVRLESGLGKGARFVLVFPAKAAINSRDFRL
jgi:signal transduction histidine kinase